MRQYKFLVLTDHRGHSKENSLYAILSKIIEHPQCEKVHLASRGNEHNHSFFYDNSGTEIYVYEVRKGFAFDPDPSRFTQNNLKADISDYDIIFMRLPRPVSSDFLHTLAEKAKDKVMINHPIGIENTGSKAYLLNFPEWCPSMKLCHSIDEIRHFARQFPIVLKPLKEYGGKEILKIEGTKIYDGEEEFEMEPYLLEKENFIREEGYLAMEFLKNVTKGDKRILVVGGEIMAASLRMPAEGSWLCNVARGGYAVPAEPDEDEVKMIRAISPRLLEEGIFIFGADTLVGNDGKRVLSEINTLSIGGFPQAEEQTGRPIVRDLVNKIITFADDKKRR